MPVAYGYVKRTKGAEGDQVDVFVGPGPNAYVIDQVDPTTKMFDEHKIVLAGSELQAVQIYASGFSDGRGLDRVGGIKGMTVPEIKKWLGQDTTKPATEGPK